MKKPYSSSMPNILRVFMILWSYNYSNSCADAFVGMNWGRWSSQSLIPSMVVDLLLQNGIENVRIFRQDDNVLEAFYESGIRATFGISNTVYTNYSSNETQSDVWIRERIWPYKDVMQFGYITIGNNPFSRSFYDMIYNNSVDAFKNMQNALYRWDLSHIKATIPHYTDVFNVTSTSKPSEADFRDDIKDKMVEYVTLLKEYDAPFFLSIFPIHFVNNHSLNLDFAFMDNTSSYRIKDINATYTNAFELLYDSCHWALAKANATSVKIIIAAIGWPTDSYPGASVQNAERFYKHFLPFIASGKGTPMRPNQKIDVFLNNLSDETRMYLGFGAYHRHWGIYKFNGEPKFKIDFSGRGGDVYPSTAKGVTHMPDRWCVFNEKYDDPLKVEHMMKVACEESDCSSLVEGGSCQNLTRIQKISYAFNRYFQTMGQASESAEEICYMAGLGKVVSDDPSTGSCIFPVEILSAENIVEGSTFGVEQATIGTIKDTIFGPSSGSGQKAASAGLLALTLLWMIL